MLPAGCWQTPSPHPGLQHLQHNMWVIAQKDQKERTSRTANFIITITHAALGLRV
jgi:hypothetical protein